MNNRQKWMKIILLQLLWHRGNEITKVETIEVSMKQ